MDNHARTVKSSSSHLDRRAPRGLGVEQHLDRARAARCPGRRPRRDRPHGRRTRPRRRRRAAPGDRGVEPRLGFGRIAASERGAPDLEVNLV